MFGTESPVHAAIYDGGDNEGHPSFNYGNGFGVYKKHAHYPDYGFPVLYYRYVGTPTERAEIAEHNAKIKAQREAAADNKLREMAAQHKPLLKTDSLDNDDSRLQQIVDNNKSSNETVQFLKKFPKRR